MAVDPIILELRADTAELRKKLAQVERELESSGVQARNFGTQATQASDKAARSLSQVTTALKGAQAEQRRLSSTIKEQEKITLAFRQEMIRLTRQYEAAGKSGTISGLRIKKQMDALNLSIKDQVLSVRQLKNEQKEQNKYVADLKRQEKELQANEKQTNILDDAFNGLGKRIAAAFAVERLVAFTREALNLADKARGVTIAFEELGEIDLDQLREATGNTVSDLELMQNAVRAEKLGVPVARLAELFQFAAIRAAETGQEVDYLVQSITTGLGRKSPLILDNLGITTTQLQDALNGVSIEAASVEQLTNALADTVSKDLNPAMMATLTNSDRLNTIWKNSLLKTGQALLPVYDETTDILTIIAKNLGVVGDNSKTAFSTEDVEDFNSQLKLVFDVSNQLAIQTAKQAGIGAVQLEKMAGEALVLANNFLLTTDNAEKIVEFLDTFDNNFLPILGEQSKELQDFIEQLRVRLNRLTEDQNGGLRGSVGILKQLKEEIKAINDQLENASSQSQINDLLDRRIAKEVQVNAILNQRKNLEDDGVDPELETPTFANDPFGNFETEAERVTASAEKVFDDFYDELLQKQAEAAQKEIEWAEFVAEQQKEITNNKLQALSGFIGAIDELLVASGKNSKELATFQAFLNLYLAISNALAQPLDPIQKAIYVATLTAQAAAQIANIQSQQVPSFYTGTPFVSDSPSKGRKKDDVVANLHYGEAVIPAAANKRNKGLSAAWIKGHEDKWIHKNYVLPALKAHIENFNKQKEKDFASNMAASMAFNMPDDRIVRELKKTRTGQYALVDALTRSQRKNPYRA